MQADKTPVYSCTFDAAVSSLIGKKAAGRRTEAKEEEDLFPDAPVVRASPLLACMGISVLLHLALFTGLSVFLWSRGLHQVRVPVSRPIPVNLLRADTRHAPALTKKRGAVYGPSDRARPNKGRTGKEPGPKVPRRAVSTKKKTRTRGPGRRKNPEFVTDHSENPGVLAKAAIRETKDKTPVPIRHAQTRIVPIKSLVLSHAGGKAIREKSAQTKARRKPSMTAKRGGPSRAVSSRPVSSTPARVLVLSKPAYPAFSRRKGEEGRVRLSLEIRENGKVQRVELLRSSGYSRLDRAAVRAAKAASFVPARRAGHPVASAKKISFTFKLRE